MITHNIPQGSDAWHVWRRGGLGGSDVAAIMGLSPWKSRAELLKEKVTGKGGGPPSFAMARGTRLEPIARRLYHERTGVEPVPVCVQHDTIPWIRVSLDGLCEQGGEQWIVEIKCPSVAHHARALVGEIPDYYRVQVQYELLACGIDPADYVSYSDNSEFSPEEQLVPLGMLADPECQADMLRECSIFWEAVLEGRRVYAATGKFAGERTVGQILADEERELEEQLREMGLAPVGQIGKKDNAAVLSEIEAGMKLAAEPGWWNEK